MTAHLRRLRVRPAVAVGAILAVLTALISLHLPTPAHAATVSTAITVDGTKTGLTFDGVGAASGGGGNSRLLIDYPEPQRSQLLDYLFKPGYGASLQVLKLEIGGDTNSTDGAEASIEHTKGAVDCNQGYEWWLAAQAKARNPHIKLYGLAWGAPGWIGGGNFWSQDMIDYLMSWMGCAKQHNLAIDYLGGWNERGYDKTWYENLRTTLNAQGPLRHQGGRGRRVRLGCRRRDGSRSGVQGGGRHRRHPLPLRIPRRRLHLRQHRRRAGPRQAAVGQRERFPGRRHRSGRHRARGQPRTTSTAR